MEASLMSLVVADILDDVIHYSVRYEKQNKNKRDRRLEKEEQGKGMEPRSGVGRAYL